MSFETWFEKFAGGRTCYQSMVEAYDGGRAESEAEIAALQSERDALREAMLGVESIVEFYLKREITAPANHQDMAEEAERKLMQFRAAIQLSTPASGEPAGKP